MSDLVISSIPQSVLGTLLSDAAESNLSVEDYTRQLVCDAAARAILAKSHDISAAQLQDNLSAFLRIAESQPIFINDELGRRFALISFAEFERLTGTSENADN